MESFTSLIDFNRAQKDVEEAYDSRRAEWSNTYPLAGDGTIAGLEGARQHLIDSRVAGWSHTHGDAALNIEALNAFNDELKASIAPWFQQRKHELLRIMSTWRGAHEFLENGRFAFEKKHNFDKAVQR